MVDSYGRSEVDTYRTLVSIKYIRWDRFNNTIDNGISVQLEGVRGESPSLRQDYDDLITNSETLRQSNIMEIHHV